MKCSRCVDCARTLLCVFVLLSATEGRRRRAKRGNGKCSADSLVEYNLSFFGDWSKDAFPRMYPKYRPHAQWSKLYGLTHGRTYKLWSEGDLASPAVQKFVEERSTLILDKTAQGYNDTYDIFTAAPIRGGLGRTSARIFADGKHSKVSFLVKIIPSPDWFVGVDGLDLCRNGRWRRKVYAHLRPLDAGTDKGLTYTSPNWPAHPPQRIFQITPSYPDHPASSFFYPDRTKLPRIAHAIIERVVEYQQRGRATAVRYNAMPNTEVIKQEHELMGSKSSLMSVADDGEEIPVNTKLDDALVEKLESDIKKNLKTAPRQTFFLQRMLKHRGQPLADQSSEEFEGDQTEVKSAASFLAQKVSIRQTTMFVPPPPVPQTTTVPVLNPSHDNMDRFSDLETSRRTEDENDSIEAAGSRLAVRPSHQMPDNTYENVDPVDVEQRTDTEERRQVDNGDDRNEDNDEYQPTDVQAPGASSRQLSNPSVNNNNAPGHEFEYHHESNIETSTQSTRRHRDRQNILDADSESDKSPNYGAAYSVSSARTLDDTQVHQRNDLQNQNNQNSQTQHHDNHDQSRSRQDNQDRTRHRHDNQDPQRHHQDNQDPYDRLHDNKERPRHRSDNQDTLRHHHDNHQALKHHQTNLERNSDSYPDRSQSRIAPAKDGGVSDGDQDIFTGRDNVNTQPNQREILESLGIFDDSYVPPKTDSNEQLDCLVGEWTPWSSCSKTCGFGVKTRSREVLQYSQNGGLNCPRLSMEVLCGSMRTCKWNHFNSLFGKYTDPKRRRRRRKRRHHRS